MPSVQWEVQQQDVYPFRFITIPRYESQVKNERAFVFLLTKNSIWHNFSKIDFVHGVRTLWIHDAPHSAMVIPYENSRLRKTGSGN
jgi:hypothetical protein